jgi:hypothetical protein
VPTAAAELLPDHSGLVLIYAGVGALGGALAAVHFSDDATPPALWGVAKRTIVGFGLGLATGFFSLARWTMDDALKYWVALYALLAGFVGPYAVWNIAVDYVLSRLKNVMPAKTTTRPKGDSP